MPIQPRWTHHKDASRKAARTAGGRYPDPGGTEPLSPMELLQRKQQQRGQHTTQPRAERGGAGSLG
jgi:hypothetical protein